MGLLKDSKEYESENCAEIKIVVSDCSKDIIEIGDCLHFDDEEVNNFISTEINERRFRRFFNEKLIFTQRLFLKTPWVGGPQSSQVGHPLAYRVGDLHGKALFYWFFICSINVINQMQMVI